MSMPSRYAQVVVQPDFAAPATSTALVPVSVDRTPRPVVQEKPVNAHRFFYAIGYCGLVLLWAGIWMEGLTGLWSAGLYIFGGMGIALGGLGIVIHTLVKPNERKVRHLLLAIGSLALTIAAVVPVQRISREWYATAAVARLQPLAEALANDRRIREIGIEWNGEVFNGFQRTNAGPTMGERQEVDALDDVLARDGVSPGEYQAYRQGLERTGMDRVERTASSLVFYPDGPRGLWLLYVIPGHALPPAHALLDAEGTYHSQPLGGSWYIVLRGRR